MLKKGKNKRNWMNYRKQVVQKNPKKKEAEEGFWLCTMQCPVGHIYRITSFAIEAGSGCPECDPVFNDCVKIIRMEDGVQREYITGLKCPYC